MPNQADPSPTGPLLRLYVAGEAVSSLRARNNLERLLPTLPRGTRVEIVDVLEHPQRALEDGVLLTPMLVRVTPLPRRDFIGSLATLTLDALLPVPETADE